ncbi:ribokinase [Spirosoma foliorum]|uniref:Ribokinase n=1 Tax=Spirosoma foliorum TaxID=2710596 RepID=A0A7G5GUA7_9BACT|nr:ribokinase [Spirosoma foliorum]
MVDICTIGHITLDKIVTSQSVSYMPGGTSFYFSKALLHADIKYKLITALAQQDYHIVDDLQAEGVDVDILPSKHTVYFQNSYSADQNHREQQVLQKAAPFRLSKMPAIDAKLFHLGPLLADDIPINVIEDLSKRGIVSLDIQGYLRRVRNKRVVYQDWIHKKYILPYVSILKANEFEMEVVTGQKNAWDGAMYLADLGVREVIITLGSEGSLIYTGGTFYEIPAFKPTAVVDATGCGDTYMAGYLLKRVQGSHVEEAGEFGAALATLKVASSGPFSGSPALFSTLLEHGIVG